MKRHILLFALLASTNNLFYAAAFSSSSTSDSSETTISSSSSSPYALFSAVEAIDADRVQKLLLADHDPYFVYEKNGTTPIMHAAARGYDDIINVFLSLCVSRGKLLSAKALDGRRAVDFAKTNGHTKAAAILEYADRIVQQYHHPRWEAHFTPDILPVVLNCINNEQQGIQGAMYSFSHGDPAQSLIDKYLTGVSVSLVINKDSGSLAIERMKKEGISIYSPNFGSDMQNHNNCFNMHHKVLLFEKNSSDRPLLITGSCNFTDAAFNRNFEDIIITDDPKKIAYYKAEMTRLLAVSTCLNPTSEEIHSTAPVDDLSLQSAVQKNNLEEVQTLLLTGRDPYAAYDENGMTPIMLAAENGLHDIINAFLSLSGDKVRLASTKANNGYRAIDFAKAENRTRAIAILEYIDRIIERHNHPFCGTYFSPDILGVILNCIKNEHQQITGAIDIFTYGPAARDLVEAHKKGVPVQLIVNNSYKKDLCIALRYMIQNGISVCTPDSFMHHKFLIFNKNVFKRPLLITGSCNFTAQAFNKNWENMIITDDPESIQSYMKQMTKILRLSKKITAKECISSKDTAATGSNSRSYNLVISLKQQMKDS